MKDYKRLTSEQDFNCRKCVNGKCQMPDMFCPYRNECERYNQLYNLENKIERGEIDYVADKDKEIARLTAENDRLKEEKTCRNIFEDENKGLFVCSKCKFNTINYYRLKLNKGDKYYHREYDIKYCPNCGARVENQQ